MDLLDFRNYAVAALLVVGCSDDGAPQETGSTGSASDSSGSQGTSTSPSTTQTSAVTGLPSSSDSDSDTAPSTGSGDPSATATEGSTTSGSSSGSGSGDSSGTETGGGPTACMAPGDCQLVNDCCTCAAIGADEEPPKCEIQECLVPTCQAEGIPDIDVDCVFGSCELETVSCDPMLVVCEEEPPKCLDGQLPSVVETCWGACVPAEVCDVVPGCEDCAEDEACVAIVTLPGPQYACTPVSPDCEDGLATCECLPDVCVEPYDTCSDQDGEAPISCACINC